MQYGVRLGLPRNSTSFLRCARAPIWWTPSTPALFFCDATTFCTFMTIQLHLRHALLECETVFKCNLEAAGHHMMSTSLKLATETCLENYLQEQFHASFLHLKPNCGFGNMMLFFRFFQVEEPLCLKYYFSLHCDRLYTHKFMNFQ